MTWKARLEQFESTKDWDTAIELLQGVIASHPHDIDAYIAMNYLLMNLLVEEQYDQIKHDEYAALAKRYFAESYSRFSENPEYLFFTGITAFMSEWYFDIGIEVARKMINKAATLEPDNILYRWGYHTYLYMNEEEHKKRALPYARLILQDHNSTLTYLKSKGAIGRYLIGIVASRANLLT